MKATVGAKLREHPGMKFSVFQVSRKGGREKNEDRMGYCYTRESGLFVLADGMGGHPEGEVAAQLALQTISALYQKEARPVVKDVSEFLTSAMAAHHQIMRYASEKGMLDTPRTTVVAAILQGTPATWVHCGDSRLYVVRDGELLTRTRDHSYLEQQKRRRDPHDRHQPQHPVHLPGLADQAGVRRHRPGAAAGGDKILLCSDGLWGSLLDEATSCTLSSGKPVSEAVPDLVEWRCATAARTATTSP
jgi:serine/threonine protein phosphatase PrpC